MSDFTSTAPLLHQGHGFGEFLVEAEGTAQVQFLGGHHLQAAPSCRRPRPSCTATPRGRMARSPASRAGCAPEHSNSTSKVPFPSAYSSSATASGTGSMVRSAPHRSRVVAGVGSDVAGDDVAGPEMAGNENGQGADGAAAGHEHLATFKGSGPFRGVENDREWLGHRRFAGGEAIGLHALGSIRHEQFAKGTLYVGKRHCRAVKAHLGAMVRQVFGAIGAATAGS